MSGAETVSPREPTVLKPVIDFCRVLRGRGVLVTPAESIAAVRALERVDLTDRGDVYHALRPVLTTRREELAIFDELFGAWWRVSASQEQGLVRRGAKPVKPDRHREPALANPGTSSPRFTFSAWAAPNEHTEGETALPSPSNVEARQKQDFASFSSEELEEVMRLARRLARRLDARPSRRWRPARQGEGARIDLRRSVRLSLKTGGDLIDLAQRKRKLRKTKLVALCDVSGSMDLYSRFLLQFLYALQHAFARVETFVFTTRLLRITPALARADYRIALDELARTDNGWSGGTKIGASIGEFVSTGARSIDRRTVVIVLSDGWDTGEPELLSNAMSAIHRRAGRVVWLNPLLGSPNFQPLTRGMQAALPHVDVFAAAHNLTSLEALARHLRL